MSTIESIATSNTGAASTTPSEDAFVGYSGPARVLGGLFALAAALFFNFEVIPNNVKFGEYAWGGVILGMMLVNYGALAHRYFSLQRRSFDNIKCAIDALPGMFAALMGTIALAHGGMYDYIFGFWLLIYGAANAAHRRVYGDRIWTLGLYYILCGTLSMLVFYPDFHNPWPLAGALVAGEIWGGAIFFARDVARHRLQTAGN